MGLRADADGGDERAELDWVALCADASGDASCGIDVVVEACKDDAVLVAAAALGGVALDEVMKLHFKRLRPELPWAFVHEHSFSFPERALCDGDGDVRGHCLQDTWTSCVASGPRRR
jgi:hypothetical protein